jgi:hypothetical protein
MSCVALVATIIDAPVLDQQPPTFTFQTNVFEVGNAACDSGVAEIVLEVVICLAPRALPVHGIVQTIADEFSGCNGDQRLQSHCVGG